MRMSVCFVCVLLLSALSAGCRCQDDGRRPYTPFGVASSLPASSATSTASATPATEPLFQRRHAPALPAPATHWSYAGQNVLAPEGWLIERALEVGVTNAPDTLVVGWLVPTPERRAASAPGSLWVLHPADRTRELSAFPPFVPPGAECAHRVDLAWTGPNTVTLDVAASCDGAGFAPRTPLRSVQVLNPRRPAPKLLGLRLAAPPAGETLTLLIETPDLDQDGHDDVKLRLTLHTSSEGPEASANVIWFDRVAGPAREFAEPAKSFAEIGSVEVVRAKGSSTSRRVVERVGNARRLFSYLCAEGGAHGVSDEDGNGIACGDLSEATGWYLQAEVEAALTLKLAGEAFAAFERQSWYGSVPERVEREILKRLAATVPRRADIKIKTLDVRTREPGSGPRLSPLGFAADGSLLIQRADGLVRYREGEIQNAEEEVDAWPLEIFGPGGESLLGLGYPCDRSLADLQARQPSGAPVTLATTPWLAPRPGVCKGTASFRPLEVRPIRWNTEGLSLLIGSAWLGPTSATAEPKLGGPLSSNGQHWVAVTSLGLFIQHEADVELWPIDDHHAPSECVIDNSGTNVACRTPHGVLLLQR